MDTADIEEWSRRYDENHDSRDELRALHAELTEIRGQSSLTRSQVESAMKWKLVNQGGRPGRYIELMRSVPDQFIELVTEAAFLLDNPKLQTRTLTSIPGIGPATASVLLTFHDPTGYAVGDRYLIR